MSAPKSAAKRQKLARKRRRKQEARQRRKRKQPGSQRESALLLAPGGVRMSDVLKQFVRPYNHLVDSEEAFRKLLTLGMLAWNAAMQPDGRQEQMVDEVLNEAVGEESWEAQTAAREIVDELIERKQRYFAQYRRPIIDFRLTDLGDQYHLTVISALV